MKYPPLFVLFLASLLSAGCKVIVEVPEGGSVTTESGEFLCEQAETCEIDVDETSFDETFVAAPLETHEFRGWKERVGGQCSDAEQRLLPCRVSIVEFAAAPWILELLEADVPVYLEPEFVPKATTTIQFPTQSSNVRSSSITVRGVATDSDRIVSIIVNGVAATVFDSGGFGTPVGEEEFTSVSWRATIELMPGNNDIEVLVEDATGNINTAEDTVTIDYLELPVQFSVDEINNRLVGPSGFTGTGFNLLSWDLDDGTPTVLSTNVTRFGADCYKADTSEYLYAYPTRFSEAVIRRLDLETQVNTLIAVVTLNTPDSVYVTGGFDLGLTCASGDDNAYFTHTLAARVTGALVTSRIVKVNIETGEQSLLSEISTASGDPTIISGVEILGGNLVAYPPATEIAPLYLVNKITGAKAQIPVRRDRRLLTVIVDPETETIYSVDFNGIYKLESGSSVFRPVSLSPRSDPLFFAQVTAAALDSTNRRILVSGPIRDTILAVDLRTGDRSEFVTRRRGNGDRMVAPRQLYVTQDESTAYVVDADGGVADWLFKVNLETGDREIVVELSETLNFTANGLDVDEAQGVAYLASTRSILAVDLNSGLVTELASDQAGTGTPVIDVSGLVLDKKNNRLLFSDKTLSAVIELDLESGDRQVLSQAGVRGDGDDFSAVSSLTFDADSNQLFAANPDARNIMSIDANSGDRRVILDACGAEPLGVNRIPWYIAYEPGELVILESDIKIYDFETGQCDSELAASAQNPSLFDIHRLANGTYLGATFGGVVNMDLETQQSVFLSE